MSSLKPVAGPVLADLVRTSSLKEFLNTEDMQRFRKAVTEHETTFLGVFQRFNLSYYYKDKEFKVWIQPAFGYAPCGSFDVNTLLQGA